MASEPRPFTCYIAGGESLLVQCADILLSRGHRILGVISADEAIREWAAGHDLPRLDLDATLSGILADTPFDFFFSITNLRVLPEAVVAAPRRMAVNFHDGPLPRYAGLHATSWALIDGATDYAITWHQITTGGIDEGDVLLQEPVAIAPGDTALTLNAKCYEAGIRSFGTLVDQLASGTATPVPQDLSHRTYFAKAKRPAGAASIRWDEPAERVAALVRALDFGPYANPLALPKAWHGDDVFTVGGIEVLETASGRSAGTILSTSPGRVVVATASADVAISRLGLASGLPADDDGLASWKAGDVFVTPGAVSMAEWTTRHEAVARHEAFWVARLARARPAALPVPGSPAGTDGATGTATDSGRGAVKDAGACATSRLDAARVETWRPRLGHAPRADLLVGAVAAFAARVVPDATDVALAMPPADVQPPADAALFAGVVALRLPAGGGTVDEAARAAIDDLAMVRTRGTFARDAIGRYPALRAAGAGVAPDRWPLRIALGEAAGLAPHGVTVVIRPDDGTVEWRSAAGQVPGWALESLAAQFDAFLAAAAADGTRRLKAVPLINAATRERIVTTWNATTRDIAGPGTIPAQIALQAARTPDRTAVVFEGASVDYATLETRARRLAHRLRALGVNRGDVVGIGLDRSIDLVVAVVAVLEAGAAYVPLDPSYPAERLGFMRRDSGARVVITREGLDVGGGDHGDAGADVRVLAIDAAAERAAIDASPATPLAADVAPGDLAYVIYTSGSTGTPKGVMVEHRNVTAFFAGMDDWIETDPPGVWLAVTSLSFDISVLELLWTLARGFTVIVQGEARQASSASRRPFASRQPIDLSFFYFASDEGERGASKYRLLMEGARFADQHGFAAVWTPERHFHAFGGLYPNPSVASAAIAAVTTRIGIRAGSVVLPLHHPVRVAEEWALVDNLSGGRVGISFASGWHPEDFILRPDAFADAKTRMMRDIETVRRLWRGERVAFPGPLGKDVEVSTLPRPVQAELPVWVTAAGNPETFRLAGEAGCRLLTHLLGQSLEELAGKVAIYRRAWRAAGHPGRGHVTLMLHTFVGDSDAAVREIVRGPMKAYLGSAVSLIKQYAWSFPAFRKRTDAAGASTDEIFRQLSEEDLDGLLEHAFERYYETSGLFGTPETCARMIDRVKATGIEEVACLIDFGVNHETVIGSLPALGRLRAMVGDAVPADEDDHSIPAAIERHGVTHLQCTPTLAGVLARDPDARLALGRLRHLMVGGEAMPAALAAELTGLVAGRVTNMYGPTETTIWSAVDAVSGDEDPVPIGRPIANTRIYVIGPDGEPAPIGMPGEVHIGGAGVVRGYHDRPDLTAARFVPDPFDAAGAARMYRTGDLARWRPDGRLEFLGRLDHQVKVRGYRIELGEIESRLAAHPSVRDAVVVVREAQAGDARLVAYVTPAAGAARPDDLRAFLKARLPEPMVPAHVVVLDALPLTPNGKVDRAKLPAPETPAAAPAALAAAENALERTVASIWQDVLQVPRVGVDQNFFDLGGHSLLTVRVLGRLREATGRSLPITDMFRFPTVRALARHLSEGEQAPAALAESDERAASRRERLAQRRRGRPAR